MSTGEVLGVGKKKCLQIFVTGGRVFRAVRIQQEEKMLSPASWCGNPLENGTKHMKQLFSDTGQPSDGKNDP